MRKHDRNIMILLSIIIFEIAVYIILRFCGNIKFQEFAVIFNNILTPIITAIALVVYYLSLLQMKKQTQSIIEEKEILHGENIYKDYLLKIQELKEVEAKKDLSKSFPKDFKKSSFTALTIYTGFNIELVRNLKADLEYKKYIQIDDNENIDDDEVFKFSLNEYYMSLNSIYNNLSLFLYKINFLLFQIEESKGLHESHRTLLIKYIAKEVLYDYFLFVLNKDHFNYYLINSGRVKQNTNTNKKLAFESFDIELVYNFYSEKYPKIIEEVLFLQRQ
jgi:hypothetical protein